MVMIVGVGGGKTVGSPQREKSLVLQTRHSTCNARKLDPKKRRRQQLRICFSSFHFDFTAADKKKKKTKKTIWRRPLSERKCRSGCCSVALKSDSRRSLKNEGRRDVEFDDDENDEVMCF